MKTLLEKVLEAHGGTRHWELYSEIVARISFGGLAFKMKFNTKGTKERTIRVSLKETKVVFENYPKQGFEAVFRDDVVLVRRTEGVVVKVRANPRLKFAGWRHKLWWDDMDLLYFAGYASWNYFNSPFILSYPGVRTEEMPPLIENGRNFFRLRAIFPANIPTHCAVQEFYFDQDYKMVRLDYCPEVFASWAKAAHYCSEYQNIDGILIPTERKVFPRSGSGKVSNKPVLVWIKLRDLKFQNGQT